MPITCMRSVCRRVRVGRQVRWCLVYVFMRRMPLVLHKHRLNGWNLRTLLLLIVRIDERVTTIRQVVDWIHWKTWGLGWDLGLFLEFWNFVECRRGVAMCCRRYPIIVIRMPLIVVARRDIDRRCCRCSQAILRVRRMDVNHARPWLRFVLWDILRCRRQVMICGLLRLGLCLLLDA